MINGKGDTMLLKSNHSKTVGLVILVIIMFTAMICSVIYGYTETSWRVAIDSFVNFDGSNEHIIIQQVRIPRALIGACVGASLGMAGCLMQSLTKNPLASPDIIGVSAGSSFFIVAALTIFGIQSTTAYTWLSFLGATISVVVVFTFSSIGKEGSTPLKLTLAGVAISALFSSLTQGLLTVNEQSLEEVMFWITGSVQGRDLSILVDVFPYLLIGWIGAILIAGKVNTLMLGDDIAKGLGQRIFLIKGVTLVVVILLSGGAVAVAGPIGFIGIMIPQISKYFVGIDHKWLIPYCGVLGAILLVSADILSRYIMMPREVPVGVTVACIGAPFFIYLAKKKGVTK